MRIELPSREPAPRSSKYAGLGALLPFAFIALDFAFAMLAESSGWLQGYYLASLIRWSIPVQIVGGLLAPMLLRRSRRWQRFAAAAEWMALCCLMLLPICLVIVMMQVPKMLMN